MSVYKRIGQDLYSYDFEHRGHRFSGSTNCTSRRAAEKFERGEKQRIKAIPIDTMKRMNFEDACALYWSEVGRHHVNNGETLRSLDWLLTRIGRDTSISAISRAIVAQLIEHRRNDGVSPTTVNRSVLEPMRAILRRAENVWKQQVQDIEWKGHFLKEPQERVREATPDEEAALLKAARPDFAPVFQFAFKTGCRQAEIVGLRWTNVDFFNGEFTVTGKGDKSRKIPMTKEIYELLWSLKGHHETAVFSYVVKRPRKGSLKGERQPITMEGLKTQWRRTRARSGVQNFRFHDQRHTFATRLVRHTGSLKMAQLILGHSDISTTSRYAHVTKEDLRSAMEKSGKLQRKGKKPPWEH